MSIDMKKVKKEKKAKKEKKEGAKERKKTAWKAKQVMRVERALKSLTKLSAVLVAAKAPSVDATLSSNALSAVSTLSAQINMLATDWKPERGSSPATSKKLGIGSLVQVKTDLDRAQIKMFKHIPAELFLNATIVEDDNRDWLVMCSDGVKRLLRKKMAQKAGTVATPPPTAPPQAAVA